MAQRYKAAFPNAPRVTYNDASLEQGGIFDLKADWKPKHSSHRRGQDIDVVANPNHPSMTVLAENDEEFRIMACEEGWRMTLEFEGLPDQHYHGDFALGCMSLYNPLPVINTVSTASDPDTTPPPPDPGTPPPPLDCNAIPNPDPVTQPGCF